MLLRRWHKAAGPTRMFLQSAWLRSQLPGLILKKTAGKIVILTPDETKDKTLEKYVSAIGKSAQNQEAPGRVKRIMEGRVLEPPWLDLLSDFEDNIDHFKPLETEISRFRAHTLIETLVNSFRKDQLRLYVTLHGQRGSKRTKNQLAEAILRDVWKLNFSLRHRKFVKELARNDLDLVEDVVVPISSFELFLLLSLRARLWKDVKALVSKVTFSKNNTELVMSGSPSRIENARVLISSYVEQCYREDVDLSGVRHLYEKKFGEFSVSSVSRFSDVYFFHMHDDCYELVSIKRAQVSRIRRLFLWQLDYNLHQKDMLLLPPSTVMLGLRLLPFISDYSMLWLDRGKRYFSLDSEAIPEPSPVLKEELERFSDDTLQLMESTELDMGEELRVAKDTYDLLESIGLMKEDVLREEEKEEVKEEEEEEKVEEEKVEVKEVQDAKAEQEAILAATVFSDAPTETNELFSKPAAKDDTSEVLIFKGDEEVPSDAAADFDPLSPERRDAIFKHLTDFKYRQSLKGVADKDLEPPVFTLTLGSLLFENKQAKKPLDVESYATEGFDMSNYVFNTNTALAFDLALANTLISKNQGISKDSDPHVYSLQLRFVPSPYKDDIDDKTTQRSVDKQMKFPPVEMWVELNHQSIPDLDTLQAVSVEGENNAYVCSPGVSPDMRISSQITGRLLQDFDPTDNTIEGFKYKDLDQQVLAYENKTPTEKRRIAKDRDGKIDTLLTNPAARFNRFISQPGLVHFLEQSQFDVAGKKGTNIAPWMVLDINGERVRYDYVNTTYRREFTLQTPEGIMVQLSVVDGGLLGGRRFEIRFVGDSLGLLRAGFEKLLDYTEEFVRKL